MGEGSAWTLGLAGSTTLEQGGRWRQSEWLLRDSRARRVQRQGWLVRDGEVVKGNRSAQPRPGRCLLVEADLALLNKGAAVQPIAGKPAPTGAAQVLHQPFGLRGPCGSWLAGDEASAGITRQPARGRSIKPHPPARSRCLQWRSPAAPLHARSPRHRAPWPVTR